MVELVVVVVAGVIVAVAAVKYKTFYYQSVASRRLEAARWLPNGAVCDSSRGRKNLESM